MKLTPKRIEWFFKVQKQINNLVWNILIEESEKIFKKEFNSELLDEFDYNSYEVRDFCNNNDVKVELWFTQKSDPDEGIGYSFDLKTIDGFLKIERIN